MFSGEDSNDSGLSSEHSANSREPSTQTQEQFAQRAVRFAHDHEVFAIDMATASQRNMSRSFNCQLRHQGSGDGKSMKGSAINGLYNDRPHSRRLPQSPSVEYHDMTVQCDAALAQLRAAQHLLQKQQQQACQQTVPPSQFVHLPQQTNTLPAMNYSRRSVMEYSSDSELHQPSLDYAARRRSGTFYSTAGAEDMYMAMSGGGGSGLSTHQPRYHYLNNIQKQQAQAEADSIYWNQKLQSLSLQQKDAARRAAAAAAVAAAVATGHPIQRPAHPNYGMLFFA